MQKVVTRRRLVAVVVAALAVLVVATTASGAAKSHKQKLSGPLVVFLLPENVTARWESQDKPFFIAAMKKDYPSAHVVVENALNELRAKAARYRRHLPPGWTREQSLASSR